MIARVTSRLTSTPDALGRAPIQYAIKDGHKETGISIMQIEEKVDTGPVLLTESTPIGDRETYGQLRDRLAELAGVNDELDETIESELLVDIASVLIGAFVRAVAEQLLATTSNPVVGLFIGILATSLVQSSSSVTSMTSVPLT